MLYFIFLTSFLALLIVWVIYPSLLFLLKYILPDNKESQYSNKENNIFLTIIIAAHNEEKVIAQRIINILDISSNDFDFEIIVMSDHSTDNTVSIVKNISYREPLVRVYEVKNGRGRAAAHNEALQHARGNILVFTDAETEFSPGFLDAIGHAYDDPRVGFASGQLVWKDNSEEETGDSVSLYWRFEIWLRMLESNLGLLATGTGACCSVRKELFKELPLVSDVDCGTPIDVAMQGYKIVLVPEAKAYDYVAATIRGEFAARSRMTAKNFIATVSHLGWLGVVQHPLISLGLFCHKLGRWFTPIFYFLTMLSGTILLITERDDIFILIIVVVLWIFLIFSCIGAINTRIPILGKLWLFLIANLAFCAGIIQALFNRSPTEYKKII